jgi:predicted dehydrogenase
MKLKLGLLGCSNVAEKNLFPYLISSQYYELYSVGSRNPAKAQRWSEKYSASHYGTYEEVLESEIDVVYISLPISMHEEWSIKAAKKGIHVICEKSSTISYQSAKKMVQSCKDNKVRILEAFSFRFHIQHERVLSLIKKNGTEILNFYGTYGMPAFPKNDIRWNKDLGGGVLNDVACYPVCASRLIFQDEPESISSILSIDKESQVDIKVDIFATFKNGKSAFLSSGFNHYYQSKYVVWGDNAKYSVERAYAVPPNHSSKISIDQNDLIKDLQLEPFNQFAEMFDAFYGEVTQTKKSSFNYEEDLLYQSIYMEAVRMSALHNQKIFLKDI